MNILTYNRKGWQGQIDANIDNDNVSQLFHTDIDGKTTQISEFWHEADTDELYDFAVRFLDNNYNTYEII